MRLSGALAVAVALILGLAGCRSHTMDSGTTAGEVDKAVSFTGSHNLVWIQGRHYRVTGAATPPPHDDSQVEVLEFFEYGCGHCYVLEPWVVAWERTKPAFIRFTRVHVTYKPDFIPHAQLFYTLKELGRVNVTDAMDLHHEVFDTIHRTGQMLLVYGDPEKSEALQVDFAARFGIPAGVFEATYRSDRVSEDLREARDAANTYQIQATPTFVVGGRYLTDVGSAGGGEHLIVLLSDLARRVQSRQ
jgi:protein dithiol oxidoreductase (disulfide-forming)